MLSILCYGRNDSHSAGLQKRAAISLNCFARLLDAPGDEIVFVDYNTPDLLPTFPEAIADTLTVEAKRRLRVIRVRPRDHARWRDRTGLAVLEPQARNAGLRRADPSNPWILSTNTDLIPLPQEGESLSALCARLAPGCWHVPRFELPEALWQGFVRSDPDGILTDLRTLGRRLPIREVVRGSDPALFDNHGDFQLMRRDDLVAVQGFDERMLNGWAVDSNLSLRLLMRLGRIGSLAGALEAFHCAHHRAVSPLHRHDRSENDYQRFYRDVIRPDLPHQADDWGFADRPLEEIRLDRKRQVWIGALEAAVPPPPPEPAASVYNPETADVPDYPAEHVLAHLLDLLADCPSDAVVGWCGARRRMLDLFLTAWRALGRTGPVLLPHDGSGGAATDAMIRRVPLADFVDGSDLFVFEFGCPSQDDPARIRSVPGAWSDDDLRALAPVSTALSAMEDAERAAIADGAAPRLLVAINAVHNRHEPLVQNVIGAGRIPFTTRLRHGHVRSPPGSDTGFTPGAIADWLGRRMGRRQPVPVSEAVRLTGWADRLLSGDLPPARMAEAARCAGALLTLLEHPRFARTADPQDLDRIRDAIRAARGSARLAGRLGPPLTDDPPAAGPFRLAAVEDWEEDRFAAIARRHFGGPLAGNLTRRSGLLWSRIRVVERLDRAGLLGPGRRIAVLADGVDPLADLLSTLCGRVDVLPVAGHWLEAAPAPGLRDPDRQFLLADAEEVADTPFDAVLSLAGPANAGGLLALHPHGLRIRVERVRVDVGATFPPGSRPTLSRASVDSTLWPGEPESLPHFLKVEPNGRITTWAVTIGPAHPDG